MKYPPASIPARTVATAAIAATLAAVIIGCGGTSQVSSSPSSERHNMEQAVKAAEQEAVARANSEAKRASEQARQGSEPTTAERAQRRKAEVTGAEVTK